MKLRDQVAERLLEMISSGDYEVGDRLPPERVLVEQMGVSRTVVREALNLLENRGLVQVEHGRGAVVSANGARAVHENLGFLLRTQPGTLWELMEMRKALEVEVAGLAAERASEEDIAAMRAALERMREKIHAPEGYVDADVEFHDLLARSAHNRVFLMMIEPVAHLLLASRRMTGAQADNARRALRAHEAILERVEAGDAEGARREMREHMMTTERDIKATLGGKGETGERPEAAG
ncbi:FadR/GntR family transcriptional regulator [Rubrobacter taiwanensis]|uniref:FadR/GntR family transcriptional regulator n=1 Tax=Rubrobacter taiwanensis TaxID=185139 RepID=UPI0014049F0F|nr:FadR/GntR family transcriptional regulator [Rubrobacter taiwanensis]